MGIFAFIQAVGRAIVAIGREIAKLARWISMTLFWLVLAVIVFGSVFLAADFSDRPYQAPPASAINAWITTVGIGIVLLLLFYGARLIRAALMAPSVWSIFGATPAVRFLGLGAVTLIYPRAIFTIVTVPIMVFGRMFSTLFTAVARPAGGADARSAKSFAGTVEQMALQLANLMYVIFTEATTALGQILDRLPPISESIIALALWVLIGQLLGTTSPAGLPGTARIRVLAYFQELGGIHRRNLALGLVFLGGIFLSIAAIVAIPTLHDEKLPENLMPAKLEAALNAILQPPTARPAAELSTTEKRKDAFASMLEALNTATSKAAKMIPVAATPGMPKDVFYDIQRSNRDAVLSQFQAARDQATNAQYSRAWAIEQRDNLRAQIAAERGQIVKIAITAYEAGLLGPLTNTQRGGYFGEIRRSVQFYLNEWQRALQSCDQAISSIDTRAGQVANELSTRAFVRDASSQQSPFVAQAAFRMTADLVQFADDTATRCSALEARPLEFNPPEAGAGWGPFAIVSRWLVRTQSQALALITGMLGFGLLGSVIARYVRGMKLEDGLSGEVVVVVIRGLSAAIVVFLSVKGGLAIVSTADAEPNAYVLFFTCLVGAVYSEDVWEWARRSFNEKFKGKRDDTEQKGTPDAPKGPSGAAPQATP